MAVCKFMIAVASCYSIAHFCKQQTSGFAIHRVSSNLRYRSQWEIPPLTEEKKMHIREILNQPYSYLGKGAQLFAFVSQDHRYVLKLCRHHHFKPHWILRILPFEWAKQKKKQKKIKLKQDFLSYKIAYDQLKKESGLIFLHLNKTTEWNQDIELIDRLGIHHRIPMDRYEFILQQKANSFYPFLTEIIETGRINEGKKCLDELINLIKTRINKGIHDGDPNLKNNFGWIDMKPYQIDIGRFSLKMNKNRTLEETLRHITKGLQGWLMDQCPELGNHLVELLEKEKCTV